MLHDLTERQTLVSKPIPSRKPRGKPSCPRPAKTKGSIQSFFSRLKCHPSGNPGSCGVAVPAAQPAPSPYRASGFILELASAAGATFGPAASRARRSAGLPGGSEPITPSPCRHSDLLGASSCLPLVPPPIRYVKGKGALSPPHYLGALFVCNTSPCHRLACGREICDKEKAAPHRGSSGGGAFTGLPRRRASLLQGLPSPRGTSPPLPSACFQWPGQAVGIVTALNHYIF